MEKKDNYNGKHCGGADFCDGGIHCATHTQPTPKLCKRCYCSTCTRGKCQELLARRVK